jgi:Kdo2-lipid IVA lauroyltransferase/acyltransferase
MKSWRHRLEFVAVALVAGIVRLMPARMAAACGTAIGNAFYLVDRPHRELAVANLEAAFPRRSPPECRAVARAVFAHFGRLLVALLRFSRLPRDRMLELVEFEGDERVRHAQAQGRGVLFFTGHFGFWELHAIVHGVAFGRVAVLARALDNPYLHAMLERVRTCTGNTVIYRRSAMRRVLRALAANEGVAILVDQHIQGADAVYVDFFNRPVATTSALAALALRTGAPVIPVFAVPLPGGRYRMVYEHAVSPPSENGAAGVREFTQRCTDVLEMYVRRHPELWLWMHRRWRDLEPAASRMQGLFPIAARHEPADLGTDE